MKFNITCDIQWIEEDGNIDDVVKMKIINSITQAIRKDTLEYIKEEIIKAIKTQVSSMVEDTYDDLLSNEIFIRDSYGDLKKTYPSTRELIKENLERYLTEKVDSCGKPSNYNSKSRFEYFINKELDSCARPWITKAIDDSIKKTKTMIEEKIKNGFSEQFLSMVNIENLIKK